MRHTWPFPKEMRVSHNTVFEPLGFLASCNCQTSTSDDPWVTGGEWIDMRRAAEPEFAIPYSPAGTQTGKNGGTKTAPSL